MKALSKLLCIIGDEIIWEYVLILCSNIEGIFSLDMKASEANTKERNCNQFTIKAAKSLRSEGLSGRGMVWDPSFTTRKSGERMPYSRPFIIPPKM